MAADAEGRFDDRLERMEATMRELRSVQAEVRSGQTWLKWGGGAASVVLTIIIAVLVAVVGVTLERSFALTDHLTNVRVDTGNLLVTNRFMREDLSLIKGELKGLRTDLGRIASAVGAKLDEQRTEIAPQ